MKPASRLSKRKSHSKSLWVTLFVLVAVFAVGLSYVAATSGFFAMYTRLNQWAHERNHQLQQKIVKVKQLAVNKKASQEIHFEFYTALPNMRVPVPVIEKRDANVRPVVVMNKSTADELTIPKMMSIKKAENSAAIFDAEKLQNAMRAEISPIKISNQVYVIQAGVFKNAVGAEKYRSVFLSMGEMARVVKINLTNGMGYSVQVGPFASKNQAELVQRQLQKKSINGIIRKV